MSKYFPARTTYCTVFVLVRICTSTHMLKLLGSRQTTAQTLPSRYQAEFISTFTLTVSNMTPEKHTPDIARQVSRRGTWRFSMPAVLGFVFLSCLWYFNATTTTSRHGGVSRPSSSVLDHKVPLEAHIMSKCPDARDCLRDLVLPTMERVADKVSFRLSFIGK